MANELFNVAGKVVVMTGGAGVLGKGISKYLAAQGAKWSYSTVVKKLVKHW